MGCKNFDNNPETALRSSAAVIIGRTAESILRDEAVAEISLRSQMSLKGPGTVEASTQANGAGKKEIFQLSGQNCGILSYDINGKMTVFDGNGKTMSSYEVKAEGSNFGAIVSGASGKLAVKDGSDKVKTNADAKCSINLDSSVHCTGTARKPDSSSLGDLVISYKKDAGGKEHMGVDVRGIHLEGTLQINKDNTAEFVLKSSKDK